MKTKEETRLRYNNMFNTNAVGCFDYPMGWNNLIYNLLEKLEYILKDDKICIKQIKEKFATLRFCYSLEENLDPLKKQIIANLILLTEIQSNKTCQICGNIFSNVQIIKTNFDEQVLCEKCHKEQSEIL